MCDICDISSLDKDVRKKRKDAILYRAAELENFARSLRDYAHGSRKPHSNESRDDAARARLLIQYLASEWL